ncbi:hypothetical protein KZ810_02635 [Sphingomonas sp. RHCKR47]|uniref:hypothetical protein n=1 Tax=Sphingomonas citricola TaxID=2862498 RepID=UPI001CA5B720|nr:hypothetical protein [Sphingomonas citricola]MBW6522384.1 hypothetical protein [Sphingomonas citricola]
MSKSQNGHLGGCLLCSVDDRTSLIDQLARDMFESRRDGTHDYRWDECSGYRVIYREFAGVVADSIDADRHGRCLLCTSNDRDGLTQVVAQALWDSRWEEGDLPWERADQWQVKYAELTTAAFEALKARTI